MPRRGMSGGEQRKLVRLRQRAFKRQHGRCYYCDVAMTVGEHTPVATTCTGEHLKPRSQGGRTVWWNVVAACQRCNCEVLNPEGGLLSLCELSGS